MPFDLRPLGRFQADFLERITSPDACGALHIFHDTWFYGLLDGLSAVYPATAAALGQIAFKAFARDYIRAHPLTSGDQTAYGAGFPVFFETHPQAGNLAWLSDVARLEWAEHHAHHAPDTTPCGFETLLDPQAWIALHPSVSSVHLTSNAEIFRGNEAAFVVRIVDSRWLVGRDRDDAVVRLRLQSADSAFIDHLTTTGALTSALEALPPDTLPQLQTCLARLVQSGFLIQSGFHP